MNSSSTSQNARDVEMDLSSSSSNNNSSNSSNSSVEEICSCLQGCCASAHHEKRSESGSERERSSFFPAPNHHSSHTRVLSPASDTFCDAMFDEDVAQQQQEGGALPQQQQQETTTADLDATGIQMLSASSQHHHHHYHHHHMATEDAVALGSVNGFLAVASSSSSGGSSLQIPLQSVFSSQEIQFELYQQQQQRQLQQHSQQQSLGNWNGTTITTSAATTTTAAAAFSVASPLLFRPNPQHPTSLIHHLHHLHHQNQPPQHFSVQQLTPQPQQQQQPQQFYFPPTPSFGGGVGGGSGGNGNGNGGGGGFFSSPWSPDSAAVFGAIGNGTPNNITRDDSSLLNYSQSAAVLTGTTWPFNQLALPNQPLPIGSPFHTKQHQALYGAAATFTSSSCSSSSSAASASALVGGRKRSRQHWMQSRCWLSVSEISEDCILEILWLLSPKHLCRLACVSREMARVTNVEHLWRRLCERNFVGALAYFQRNCRVMISCRQPLWKGLCRVLRTMKISLEFVDGPETGNVFTVTQAGCSIGRSRSNQVCILMDDMVSRRHVVITYHHNSYWIRDVGGINGTFVNLQPLPQFVEQRLELDDVVDLGVSSFRVRPNIMIVELGE